MRNFKVLVGLAAGIVVLLGAALLGVWLLVNPNQFKGRIAAAVKESTGRELRLSGDIKLSVFPWIALELGPATLGNPPGFSEEPFLSLAHASVRVKLLPLLRERLEVARVDIDGLDVRLRKNAEGRGNWQGADLSPHPEPKPGVAPDDAARFSAPLGRLSGLLHFEHMNNVGFQRPNGMRQSRRLSCALMISSRFFLAFESDLGSRYLLIRICHLPTDLSERCAQEPSTR